MTQANDDGKSNPDSMDEDGPNNWVETVKFHKDPQKSIAASGTRSGEIFVWDVTKQHPWVSLLSLNLYEIMSLNSNCKVCLFHRY